MTGREGGSYLTNSRNRTRTTTCTAEKANTWLLLEFILKRKQKIIQKESGEHFGMLAETDLGIPFISATMTVFK